MNRRRFLAAGGAFGATVLAGCVPSYEYRIADVEGIDDSKRVRGREHRGRRGASGPLHSSGNPRRGGRQRRGSRRCNGEDDPSPFETDLGPGEESVYIPLGCTEGDDFEVHVVAKGPAGQPVDYITVTIDIIKK